MTVDWRERLPRTYDLMNRKHSYGLVHIYLDTGILFIILAAEQNVFISQFYNKLEFEGILIKIGGKFNMYWIDWMALHKWARL